MNDAYKSRLLLKKRIELNQLVIKICLNCRYEDLTNMEDPCDDCLNIPGVFNWEAKEDDVKV